VLVEWNAMEMEWLSICRWLSILAAVARELSIPVSVPVPV